MPQYQVTMSLSKVLFRRRAQRVMPQVREWMNIHSWLVNIIACGIFIVLILFENHSSRIFGEYRSPPVLTG